MVELFTNSNYIMEFTGCRLIVSYADMLQHFLRDLMQSSLVRRAITYIGEGGGGTGTLHILYYDFIPRWSCHKLQSRVETFETE